MPDYSPNADWLQPGTPIDPYRLGAMPPEVALPFWNSVLPRMAAFSQLMRPQPGPYSLMAPSDMSGPGMPQGASLPFYQPPPDLMQLLQSLKPVPPGR